MRLIQLTDSHLFAHPEQTLLGIPTLASFRLVVEEVFERLAPVDALVLTGDLSQDASRESYELLRDVVADYRVPAYCLPGNHDDAELMREVLSGDTLSCVPVAELGAWRFVLLDSVVPGHDYGQLRDGQYRLLDDALAGGMYSMVFVHHPPVAMDCPWLDTMRLRDGPQLLDALRPHDRCRAVVFGHAHQEFAAGEAGRTLYCTPSTCLQFLPRAAKFMLDSAHPGCRVFDLETDGSMRTFVHRLPFYPFLAAPDAAGY